MEFNVNWDRVCEMHCHSILINVQEELVGKTIFLKQDGREITNTTIQIDSNGANPKIVISCSNDPEDLARIQSDTGIRVIYYSSKSTGSRKIGEDVLLGVIERIRAKPDKNSREEVNTGKKTEIASKISLVGVYCPQLDDANHEAIWLDINVDSASVPTINLKRNLLRRRQEFTFARFKFTAGRDQNLSFEIKPSGFFEGEFPFHSYRHAEMGKSVRYFDKYPVKSFKVGIGHEGFYPGSILRVNMESNNEVSPSLDIEIAKPDVIYSLILDLSSQHINYCFESLFNLDDDGNPKPGFIEILAKAGDAKLKPIKLKLQLELDESPRKELGYVGQSYSGTFVAMKEYYPSIANREYEDVDEAYIALSFGERPDWHTEATICLATTGKLAERAPPGNTDGPIASIYSIDVGTSATTATIYDFNSKPELVDFSNEDEPSHIIPTKILVLGNSYTPRDVVWPKSYYTAKCLEIMDQPVLNDDHLLIENPKAEFLRKTSGSIKLQSFWEKRHDRSSDVSKFFSYEFKTDGNFEPVIEFDRLKLQVDLYFNFLREINNSEIRTRKLLVLTVPESPHPKIVKRFHDAVEMLNVQKAVDQGSLNFELILVTEAVAVAQFLLFWLRNKPEVRLAEEETNFLVIDVGAGTTDINIFSSIPPKAENPNLKTVLKKRVNNSVEFAGNKLDECIASDLKELFETKNLEQYIESEDVVKALQPFQASGTDFWVRFARYCKEAPLNRNRADTFCVPIETSFINEVIQSDLKASEKSWNLIKSIKIDATRSVSIIQVEEEINNCKRESQWMEFPIEQFSRAHDFIQYFQKVILIGLFKSKNIDNRMPLVATIVGRGSLFYPLRAAVEREIASQKSSAMIITLMELRDVLKESHNLSHLDLRDDSKFAKAVVTIGSQLPFVQQQHALRENPIEIQKKSMNYFSSSAFSNNYCVVGRDRETGAIINAIQIDEDRAVIPRDQYGLDWAIELVSTGLVNLKNEFETWSANFNAYNLDIRKEYHSLGNAFEKYINDHDIHLMFDPFKLIVKFVLENADGEIQPLHEIDLREFPQLHHSQGL